MKNIRSQIFRVFFGVILTLVQSNGVFGQTLPPLPPPPTPTPVPTPTAPRTKPIKYSTLSEDRLNTSGVTFQEVTPNQGFDEWPIPRWMSVRTGTINKMGALIKKGSYAKGLAMVSNDRAIAETTNQTTASPFAFVDVASDAEGATAFTYDVRGKTKGQTVVKAMMTGNKGGRSVEANRLEVEVRNQTELTCDFFFIVDAGGHQSSAKPENVDAIVSVINTVYELQANIKIKRGVVKTIPITSDTDTFGTAQDTEVRSEVTKLNPTGDKYFILTWKIAPVGLVTPLGYAPYNDTFVFSGVTGNHRNSDVLAHELGHSLNLVHQPRNSPGPTDPPFSLDELRYQDMLMFPEDGGSQYRLRKQEIKHLKP